MVDINQIDEQLENINTDTARLPSAMEKPIRSVEGSEFGMGKISMGPVLVDLPSLAAKDKELQMSGEQECAFLLLICSFQDMFADFLYLDNFLN